MNCEATRTNVPAYLDDELGPAEEAALADHLRSCAGCRSACDEQQRLIDLVRRHGRYFDAPEGLADRIDAALPKPRPERARLFVSPWQWGSLAAAMLLVAVMSGGLTYSLAIPADRSTEEAVAAHVRSLMADHLTDVASSDQHTVKPWFAGRLDISPPVRDLSADGFPLVGGRLDYLDGRPVAAVVYRHQRHVINVFVSPATEDASAPLSAKSRQGYSVLRWHRSGLAFTAVSDLGLTDLARLPSLLSPDEIPASSE